MSTRLYYGKSLCAPNLDNAYLQIKQKTPVVKEFLYQHALDTIIDSSVGLLLNYCIDRHEIYEKFFNFSKERAASYKAEWLQEQAVPPINGDTVAFSCAWSHALVENNDKKRQDIKLYLFAQPVRIEKKKHYLLYPHWPNSIRPELDNIFSEVLKEYGYWNNTDKPPAVSTGQWRQRRKQWNELFVNKSGDLEHEALTVFISSLVPADLFWERSQEIKQSVKENKISIQGCVEQKLKKLEQSMLFDILLENAYQKIKEPLSMREVVKINKAIEDNELSAEQQRVKMKIGEVISQCVSQEVRSELLLLPASEAKNILLVESRAAILESNLEAATLLSKKKKI